MAILPPTVGERLARCGTAVDVWGIVPGASVDLLVTGAAPQTQVVAGSGVTFTVAGLNAGDVVTARQSQGGETSMPSPGVIVGDVDLPPPPPRIAPQIFRCSRCVYADGLAPGSTVTLLQRRAEGKVPVPVGTATADRGGTACFAPGFISAGAVFARATTCAQESNLSAGSALVDVQGSLPAPQIGEPVFGCQTGIPISGLTQGASVEVFRTGGSLGSFCSCWGAVFCNLGVALAAHDAMTAQQSMIDAAFGCTVTGAPSAPVTVADPDQRIKPVLRPLLYDGDVIVRVGNQIPGGQIELLARNDAASPEASLGRAGASQFEEVSLAGPLHAGQILRCSQLLCGHTEISDPVTVQPLPAALLAPVVRSPLYACGVLVAVDGVLTGAAVRVSQNGFPIGFAWATGPSVSVRVGPGLVQGRGITATQTVGGTPSLPSVQVVVQALASLPPPVILPPLRVGDGSVRVGGVVPGAFVQVFDGTQIIRTADAADPVVAVTLWSLLGAASAITAVQTLCGQSSAASAPGPAPIVDPSQPGGFTPSPPVPTSSGSFNVPANPEGPGFTAPITGEITYPAAPGNPNQVDPSGAPYPLVVLAHGNHFANTPSYQGYRYLASHLASQGMICVSADLNVVAQMNDLIEARGQIILQHARAMLARNSAPGDLLQGMIDPSHIGLFGHSRGAEGVVSALVINNAQPPASQLSILGVLPLAPTNFLNLRPQGPPVFILYGSYDRDVDGHSTAVNPFFIYDHGQTKAMVFVHRARHNGFNTVWVATDNESVLPGTLSPDEHQAIAKPYVSAFFQSTLYGRTAYDVFLQGPVKPQGLEGYSIHTQWHVPNRLTVDNFGDPDPQVGLAAENPIDRTTNSLVLPASFSQTGTAAWFDAEMSTVSQNPHDSRASQLQWAAPEAYNTALGSRDVSSFAVLSLRLGQRFDPAQTLNPDGLSQDLNVTLVTSAGEATIRVGSLTDLPFPDVRPDGLTKAALKTVRIPLASFVGVNPAVRLDQVNGVRLSLGTTGFGAVSVDDIDFSA